jgi:hypothetical protein
VQKRFFWLLLLCALFTVREHRDRDSLQAVGDCRKQTAESRRTENQSVRQFSVVAFCNVRSTSTLHALAKSLDVVHVSAF